MRKCAAALAISALVVAAASSAMATTVIDFDSLEIANSSMNPVTSPYVEDGFKIAAVAPHLHSPGQLNTDFYAGSAALNEGWPEGLLILAPETFGPIFDLTSIDLSVLQDGGTSPAVEFTGYVDAGGTVTAKFTPLTFGFTTFTFPPSFRGLSSVDWYQGDGVDASTAHQFDNIVINGTVIPEPMTMLAVGLAVGSLGGYVRKRRAA